jgi:hypothetical protein
MLETLISSKTRVKLLLRFFLNPENTAHLRGLADEFGESTNAIRLELNRFEDAEMLLSEKSGNRKLYKANKKHPLFPDVHSILFKMVGIDHIINHILNNLGNLEKVYLTGDVALGKNGDLIDIIIIGDVNKTFLMDLIDKAEKKINKRIRYITYLPGEFVIEDIELKKYILIWKS